MPGRYYLTRSIIDIAQELELDATAVLDEPGRRNIAPGENVIVAKDGALSRMRWGILPVARKNARGRPVMETIINARSETVFDKSAFEGVARCVVPADGWYEWTGEKRKKTAWRLRRRDGNLLWFAAIFDVWSGPGGISLEQVATVTCPPNADVEPIHHRMGVLLNKETARIWLQDTIEAASALMLPLENGLLEIEPADDVNWDAP